MKNDKIFKHFEKLKKEFIKELSHLIAKDKKIEITVDVLSSVLHYIQKDKKFKNNFYDYPNLNQKRHGWLGKLQIWTSDDWDKNHLPKNNVKFIYFTAYEDKDIIKEFFVDFQDILSERINLNPKRLLEL